MKPPVLDISQHTGLILAFNIKTMKLQGPPEQLRTTYVNVQRHCLLLGWWSVMSLFIVNPATILLNMVNWAQYKKKYAKYVQQTTGLPPSPIS